MHDDNGDGYNKSGKIDRILLVWLPSSMLMTAMQYKQCAHITRNEERKM